MKFLIFFAIAAINLAFVFSDENVETSAEQTILDVAEEIRAGMCRGGSYSEDVAYKKIKFAPVSFCQRHCEDYPLLPVCTIGHPPVVRNGCVCAPGFIRQLATDNCVKPEEC